MNIYPGDSSFSSNPGLFTVVGDLMFFLAKSDHLGFQLWVTDGTVENTEEVVEPETGVTPASLEEMTAYNGKLYFTATTTANGRELWVSDGTSEGTTMVTDLNSGSFSSDPEGLTVADGKLYFSAETASFGRELWVSNGTEAGTILVEDIYPGEAAGENNDSWPGSFVEMGGGLYFFAIDGTYNVTVQARSANQTDVVSRVSAAFEVDINDDEIVEAEVVTGPTTGIVGVSYSFTLSATSNLEHDLEYLIHWGDGTPEEWLPLGSGLTSIQLSHAWDHSEPEPFPVDAEVRCIAHQIGSPSSEGITIAISDPPPGWIFSDGFESGDVGQWSSSVGLSP